MENPPFSPLVAMDETSSSSSPEYLPDPSGQTIESFIDQQLAEDMTSEQCSAWINNFLTDLQKDFEKDFEEDSLSQQQGLFGQAQDVLLREEEEEDEEQGSLEVVVAVNEPPLDKSEVRTYEKLVRDYRAWLEDEQNKVQEAVGFMAAKMKMVGDEWQKQLDGALVEKMRRVSLSVWSGFCLQVANFSLCLDHQAL
jgi:hypothetical protein